MAFDIGSIVAKVTADISDFKQKMAEAEKSAGGLKSGISAVGGFMGEVAKQSTLLAGGVAAGVGLAAKIGLESAGKFEQYQIAFTTLLRDQKKAAEAIANIQKDAAATPFELAPLVMANQRLISAGINAGQARKDILNLGDAISATGGGNAELERLSTNLQQIKAVGKASALDIKQFAFAGINVYDMLAKSTGKNVEEVKNMDVSYEVLSKSFEKAAGKGGMFEGAMKNQSTTLNGLMSTLRDTVSLGLKDILMDSGIFDAIRNGVAASIPLIQSIVDGIVSFVHSVTDLSSQNQFTPYIQGFLAAFQAVSAWVKENQALVITFLEGLAFAIGSLVIIGTITALIFAFTNPLVLAALLIAALFTAYQTNFLGIKDITNAVVGELMHVFNDILMPLIQLLTTWVQDHWVEISLITSGIWKMISGVIQLAWAVIYGIISVGLALLKGDWGKAWTDLYHMGELEWGAIKNIFSGALEFMAGWGIKALHNLVSPFEDAWNKISDIVTKIKDALDFTKRHSPSVLDIVQNGVKLVNRAFDDLSQPFGDNFHSTIGSGIAPVAAGGGSGMINIDLSNALISDEASAMRIGEMIGDSILAKVKQNVRI